MIVFQIKIRKKKLTILVKYWFDCSSFSSLNENNSFAAN